MPRPISYAVFCLKKKNDANTTNILHNGYGTYIFSNANDDMITVDVVGHVVLNNPKTADIYTLSLHDALPIFAFDADPKFFACLVRFESSSVPTTLPTAYDVYPLDGRHDGGYYTVKDCVTIDVLPRTPGNNVYVGFMVWSNFTATKCRGLV